MKNLVASGILVFLAFGCSTSTFQVMSANEHQADLLVSTDRILVECEALRDHDEWNEVEGRYGFMMHILDEDNTVINFIHGSVTDRKTCFRWQNEVLKIIIPRGLWRNS